MNIREFSEGDAERWDAFVDNHAEATFFHRAGWRDVITESFGHSCPFLIAEDGGKIVGVLPLVEIKSFLFGHALISNGYSVCGGPVAADDAIREALTKEAINLLDQSGADYLEYRCPATEEPDWASKSDLYAGFSWTIEEDEEANLKQIPRKQRAVLRKALKNDLTVRVDESIDTLYGLYALSVRNLGTPVFGRKYFENLHRLFGENCRIFSVYAADGTPLSSVMNFYFKDQVLPFYTGANPMARKLGASDIQYWHTMRDAVQRGLKVFDFGRSKVGTGPYNFKKNWGFKPEPLTHQFYLPEGNEMPNVNPTNPKYKLFIEVWKRLPLPVANALGPWIVRGVG